MLEERDKSLAEEELLRAQEKKKLLKYSKEIRKQLEERELIRVKEVERIEEEAVAMKKALETIEKVSSILGQDILPLRGRKNLPRIQVSNDTQYRVKDRNV